MRQFFLDISGGDTPLPGDTVALDRDESHHLSTVLRGGRDEVLRLVDGSGHRLTGKVAGTRGKQALVLIDSVSDDPAEFLVPRLVLACAIVKGKRFEWALEKAVELGVHEIVPLRCEHGVVAPREGKQSRWVSIMKSAVKQCGRSWLPDLTPPLDVAAAVDRGIDQVNFFGAAPWERPGRQVLPWADVLGARPGELPANLGFFVGPEGGWSPAELDLLSQAATPVSLGPHILRAETAAAVGVNALQTIRQSWAKRA